MVDATYMSAEALDAFLAEEIEKTRSEGVLFSLHLKATMMKVSDPIVFGHAVRAMAGAGLRTSTATGMEELGVNAETIRGSRRASGEVKDRARDHALAIEAVRFNNAERPPMYMVDSDRGITNLHVPSDVIIDASDAGADPRRRQGMGHP